MASSSYSGGHECSRQRSGGIAQGSGQAAGGGIASGAPAPPCASIVDGVRDVVEGRGERHVGGEIAAARSCTADLARGQLGASRVLGQLREEAVAGALGGVEEGELGRGGGRLLSGRPQRGEEAPRRPRQAHDRSRPPGGVAQPLQGLPDGHG
jgi:hypothetical protein